MAKRAAKPAAPCPVEGYARAVVAGEVVAGRLVRLACERHLRDLQDGPARGLVWDAAKSSFALQFFSRFLRLAGGAHEGKPFLPSPWQVFVVGSLFGWVLADGSRRFRTAYIETGKGNGKSPLVAGIGLKCLVADGEARAEVYAAATKRDQAMILFRDAVAMVKQSPDLKKRVRPTGPADREWNLAHLESGSWFRPISSDQAGQSGPRVHCGIIDELHEHRTPVVVDMLRAGVKGRRQPMILEITNSGHDRASVCWQHHQYSAQVLEGELQNDEWFAYVCGLDPCEKCRGEGQDTPQEGCPDCDDWRDEACWPKANPNLGVSVPAEYLRGRVTEALGMPAAEGEVKRLNFCLWTQVASRVIPADRWAACGRDLDYAAFKGRECCGALDIGATSDFCAFVLVLGHDGGVEVQVPVDPEQPDGPTRPFIRRGYTLLPWFWLPETPRKRDEHTAALIESWRQAGVIRTTPGDFVDYARVFLDIRQIALEYPVRKLAIDRGFQGNWISGKLVDLLGSDVVVDFAQGIVSMNAPFRELLELVKSGQLEHPNHQVLNWMAGNCAAETRGGLIKPSKDKSAEKIDGVTAATMALGVAMAQPVYAGAGGVEFW